MRLRDRALVPLAIAVAVGAIGAFAIPLFAPPSEYPELVRVVAVYDASVIAMLAFYWFTIVRSDVAATRARAASEDPGRNLVLVVILIAVVFGLTAAFNVLLPAPNQTKQHTALVYFLGFAAVIFGWFLIHTVFVFRYAHLYYRDRNRDKKSDGGLTFPGTQEPSDLDFAYFSFVLGMTFQVSDVQITDPRIRAWALVHGLVSFGYNTAILALVVNTVAGSLH